MGDTGEEPGAPVFLEETEARRAENFFGEGGATSLIRRSGSATEVHYKGIYSMPRTGLMHLRSCYVSGATFAR